MTSVGVLVNGYPGSGKTTVAKALAASLPGALWCDLDELAARITPVDDEHVGLHARNLAGALITAQLSTGRPIVISQLVGYQPTVDDWAAAAARAGSELFEFLLDVPRPVAFERFLTRGGDQQTALGGDDAEVKQGFDDLCDRLDQRVALAGDVDIVAPSADARGTAAAIARRLQGLPS